MEKELSDFKCALEAAIIAMQKEGTIKDFYEMKEFTEREQWIKDYITKNGVNFFLTHPIGDDEFLKNRALFEQRAPDISQELYINFQLFENLVRDHLNEGYTIMKISFRELTNSTISEFSRMMPENQLSLKSIEGYLYASLSFHEASDTAKPDKHYFVFNLDRYYEVDPNQLGNFDSTNLGRTLTNASNDAYVANSIRYELILVKQYIDRMHMYLEGCLKKSISRLEFIPCIGRKKTVSFGGGKQSIYLATMPSDNNKQLFNADFPYYDQGSLEP
ncbi:hypothetical protein [Chryseobacterium sp.]|jgi:hypothetical protein|uniref:hypothetical protein n=1 Tax=Chryseobacterium sp. TaxID=1871047 RepID=UPI002840D91D|nr:hypothetical protein [Chryseobacterium sp.]MDR3024575.1 hypothetical protein [Chryseobacterium sp.]